MTIEKILGYEFVNKRILEEALTHPGCAETHKKLPFNYQRLEFLGDSVLGLVIAELLFKLYPEESEGNLAKRHAALVRGESLVTISRRLGLAEYIKISNNKSVARDTTSNLEDVCESLIGALYLDGGFEVAKNFIINNWTESAKKMGEPPKDSKTALQEWAQSKGLSLPSYTVVKSEGPSHAPEFTVEASIEGGMSAVAKSSSKRQAEQIAAKMLLQKI